MPSGGGAEPEDWIINDKREKNMNRKLLLIAVAVFATTAAKAQYVTYNHDSSKQNQITVMETGTGALSPDLYYSVLHNKYKKSGGGQEQTVVPHAGRYQPVQSGGRSGSHRLRISEASGD